MIYKKSKKDFMAIKVDSEKAYDQIHWDFLYDMLIEMDY